MVAIVAAELVAVLYGAYTLFGGWAWVSIWVAICFRATICRSNCRPRSKCARSRYLPVRGSLPWYNFLNSPTTWDLDDLKYFFDQISKMKQNFVGFHAYDSEPFAPCLKDGPADLC